MRLYSVENVIIRIFNQQNQVNPSPLVLTLYGSNYQQPEKRNPSDQMAFLGEILKLGGEAMIPYLARLLDITKNNNAITDDCKKAIVVLIYKGGYRSVVGNNRPVSLTSVACRQMERVVAGYLRQVWQMCGWLYDGQHGFRPGYSCDSQLQFVRISRIHWTRESRQMR